METIFEGNILEDMSRNEGHRMSQNQLRIGNPSSSEIVALLSMGSRHMEPEELIEYKKQFPKSQKKTIECWPGDAALTYIEECNMERRLGRSLDHESNARPLAWGKLLEPRAGSIAGSDYIICSTQTIQHDEFPYWVGSPDAIKNLDTVVDFKCPMTLKSFCTLVDSWATGGIEHIRRNHQDGEKYYWQLISNAILLGRDFCELIVYMPYESELQAIREMAEGKPNCYWVWSASDDELPSIKDGGYYKNLNTFRFPAPIEDKDRLTAVVEKTGKLLIQIP